MITATSTVKSVSQGTANARPKWVWHPQCATEVSLAPQCATQVGLAPECATQVCLIRANVGLDRLIRAHFGLDSLVRAGLGRAPHPGNPCVKWNNQFLIGSKLHELLKCEQYKSI